VYYQFGVSDNFYSICLMLAGMSLEYVTYVFISW
jgi:hypothetical protein